MDITTLIGYGTAVVVLIYHVSRTRWLRKVMKRKDAVIAGLSVVPMDIRVRVDDPYAIEERVDPADPNADLLQKCKDLMKALKRGGVVQVYPDNYTLWLHTVQIDSTIQVHLYDTRNYCICIGVATIFSYRKNHYLLTDFHSLSFKHSELLFGGVLKAIGINKIVLGIRMDQAYYDLFINKYWDRVIELKEIPSPGEMERY